MPSFNFNILEKESTDVLTTLIYNPLEETQEDPKMSQLEVNLKAIINPISSPKNKEIGKDIIQFSNFELDKE